jgi:hypothetical protein
MTEVLSYLVVFENKIDGVRTIIPFANEPSYRTWQQNQETSGQDLTDTTVAIGVTNQRAHELCDEVPIENYVARAMRESTNPDTSLLDDGHFNFELTNVILLQQLRTKCSFGEANMTVRLAAIKMIAEGITRR